ncbi:MAG: hypothetical protein Q9169_004444 [Polycauliona sp. 2 TL-2023]
MQLVSFLTAALATFTFLPGILAVPAPALLSNLQKRSFTINPGAKSGTQIWPDHKLKYKFDTKNSKDQLEQIVKDGWKLWTDAGVDKTKIDIIESSDDDALVINATAKPSAQTTIGKVKGAKMIFGTGKDYGMLDVKANMAHELGHALGYYHEHQRYDRDDHVIFNCQNLADWTQDKEDNGFCTDWAKAPAEKWSSQDFIKLPEGESNPPIFCYTNFDEASIMHYSGFAGSKKPKPGQKRKPVLVRKRDNQPFPKNLKPSSRDAVRANNMYTDDGENRCPPDVVEDPPPEDPEEEEPTEPEEPEEEDCEEGMYDSEGACEDGCGGGECKSGSTALVSLAFFFLYTIYGAIWRLYFSPIAHIPGPRLAALTLWNETYYDIFLGGRYTWKIADYHETYGPIIRINPFEVHVNDPDFFGKLFVGFSKGKVDRSPWAMRGFGTIGNSHFTTIDHDLHRTRRAPWNPYFSKQSIRRIHPELIQPLVDKFCARLDQQWKGGKTIIMTNAWATLTADIVSEYSYPHGYNLLDKPDFDSEHHDAWMAFSAATHPSRHFPWLFRILDVMPLWVTKYVSNAFYMTLRERERLLEYAKTLIANRAKPAKNSSSSSSKQSLLQTLTETDLLPEADRTPERITSESQLAISAGTVTTSHCLTTATYHILASPHVNSKLMQELKFHFPDPDAPPPSLDQLEQLPYLKAVMYESLRIFYGGSHRMARIFPDRAMRYVEYTIPAGTPVSMTAKHIHDNEDIYPDHYAFRPERWLPFESRGNGLLKYLVTFGGGSRGCVGIEFAKAELLTALAGVWRRFGERMVLRDTERGRDVDCTRDMFNAVPSRESNGVLVALEEEKEGEGGE